jgi:energy-coupling factor transporter ATP-binding protein EcfA2
MSNYLMFITPETARQFVSHAMSRFTLPYPTSSLQQDDRIILARVGARDMALPFIYKITATNRTAGNMTLEQVTILNRACSLSELQLRDLNSSVQNNLQLTQERFESIVQQMGGPRVDEKTLLENIERYITARGYYFERETLLNYHICLKTRPFVILAGLSGTGKSKLSQLYAEALGHKTHYLRLPVRPNWSDDHYLLGYFNTITNRYMTAPAVEFLLKANADEDNLYLFCLDEMNLAHVEYYFSQFLSAMEEKPGERWITLLSKSEQAQMQEDGTAFSVLDAQVQKTGNVQIPNNFFVTGTINVDETTQPISDKVMDRANTLEFFRVDLDKIPQPGEVPEPFVLSASTWQSYQATKFDTSFRSQIIAISQILNKADLGLGYRVLHEIELYLANSAGLLDPLMAFDLQVKQRILPRVRGSVFISEMLNELQKFLVDQKLERSEQRLDEMKSRLKRDGYTNFWR